MKTKRFVNIPIFIPELACPHQCVFCNQETISGHSSVPRPDEVAGIVDEYLTTIDVATCRVHIAFFGGSFTGIPVKLQNEYLSEAKKYIDAGRVHGIRLSTRPDYITHETVLRLKEFGVACIELGAQSLDETVLRKTGRNHSVADVENASAIIKQHGIELGLQMMLGLPGDSFEKSYETARRIVEVKADNTRIYPCLVIKGTALEKMYRYGKYRPLSIVEAVEWTKQILPLFEQNGVKVLRTGLHPSDEFDDPDALIDGPYHPAFKALVLSAIWRDRLGEINGDGGSLLLKVHPSELNFAVGHQQSNKLELLRRFKEVKFIPTDEIEKGGFQAIIED